MFLQVNGVKRNFLIPSSLLSSLALVGSGDFEVNWEKATKFAKYATSSLTYEDKDAAIEYLQKALNLLTTGHE